MNYFILTTVMIGASQMALAVKNPSVNAQDIGD